MAFKTINNVLIHITFTSTFFAFSILSKSLSYVNKSNSFKSLVRADRPSSCVFLHSLGSQAYLSFSYTTFKVIMQKHY